MEPSDIEMKTMLAAVSRAFCVITPTLHHSIIPFLA
jgi:hypothetical protein